MLHNPIEILSRLSKTYYILQKYYLVLTYCDETKGDWHMLMPKEVRDSLAPSLPFYLDCATKGVKAPSAKDLRMMRMLQRLYGDGE